MLCWRRLLRVPWTARRSNQTILKEISPEYSLEGLMLKLKFQYFATWCEELTRLKRPWCWERFGAGGKGDDRGWDGWKALLTQWAWVLINSRSWWWTGGPGCCSAWGHKESDMTEWLKWTDTSERGINTYDLFFLKACTTYWDKFNWKNPELWQGRIQLILSIWYVSHTVLHTGNIVVNKTHKVFYREIKFDAGDNISNQINLTTSDTDTWYENN